jgi:uncharacterized protein YigA (DUF484 family)
VKLVKAVLSLLDAEIHTALLARVHRQLRAALQLGVVGRLDLKKDKKNKDEILSLSTVLSIQII